MFDITLIFIRFLSPVVIVVLIFTGWPDDHSTNVRSNFLILKIPDERSSLFIH